ncbi:MAG: DUF4328 domain-containing protein [Mycobacterium sp.]|nr:DUF4328 domain-containing protein [Mycobacterium sp.]
MRDRRREWCPRCGGALLAPAGPVPAAGPPKPQAPRVPVGYRWIAVRPGPAPKPHREQQPLGPTPHYDQIPQWGLVEHFDDHPAEQEQARRGPSPITVHKAVRVAMIALGVAALMHVVRYVLLLINRTVLLDQWVALAGSWLGVAASVVALFSVLTVAVVLTNWLIARRSVVYQRAGTTDPRRRSLLWLGCLVPVVNLLMAPVFVTEMAAAENRMRTLRRPIGIWWSLWTVAALAAAWSVWGMFATDPQGIADSTEVTTIAYLLGMVAIEATARLYQRFDLTQAEASGPRWVVTPDEADGAAVEGETGPEPTEPDSKADTDSAVPVEATTEEPAA